jgi:hypothetical protein
MFYNWFNLWGLSKKIAFNLKQKSSLYFLYVNISYSMGRKWRQVATVIQDCIVVMKYLHLMSLEILPYHENECE